MPVDAKKLSDEELQSVIDACRSSHEALDSNSGISKTIDKCRIELENRNVPVIIKSNVTPSVRGGPIRTN